MYVSYTEGLEWVREPSPKEERKEGSWDTMLLTDWEGDPVLEHDVDLLLATPTGPS